tara:strand:+ start:395 stop:763 length:369 start_codon:yes stop_codon:yes gene_type:complete
MKFRSGLEKSFWEATTGFQYEPVRLPYVVHRKYVPDFICDRTGAMIETKGYFRVGDTQKYKAIRDCIDRPLIFVFSNPKTKVRKGSKTTLGDWCDKEGFAYFSMKTINEFKEYLQCLAPLKK